MAYDPDVISAIAGVLNRYKAPPRVRKAAAEATIVESGGKNLKYGDRDSLGAFQQRPSQGWGTPQQILDPEYAATQFVTRAIAANKTGKYKSAGQLAQAVQHSAFPDRYDAVGQQAASLLGGLTSSSGGQVQPQANKVSVGSSAGSAPQPLDPGTGSDVTSLLSSLLAKPQQQAPQSMGIQAPSFSAAPPLPKGFQGLLPSAAPAAPAQSGVSDALSLAAALGSTGPTVGSPGASQTADGPQMPQATGGSSGATGGVSQHARPGDPVVSSKQSVGGLHQTDGLAGYPAHDFFAPAGSHAVAPVSGTVIKLSGHDPKNGPTNGPHGPLGWSAYIKGDDGRTYFLTHMGSRNLKVGETVKQGQVIGTVADYDKYGTPSHIHLGVSG